MGEVIYKTSKYLRLIFLDQTDKKIEMQIPNIRDDITVEAVQDLADFIILHRVPDGARPESLHRAVIVETTQGDLI